MSGQCHLRVRRAARRLSLGPAAALMSLPSYAASASQEAPAIQQSAGGFGGWVVVAVVVASLLLFRAVGMARAEDRSADGWMDTRSLAQALATSEPPVLVDVREPDEFVGPLGHIKGAINKPLNGLTSNPSQLAAYKDKPVALVCRTDRRASAAAFALRASGFKQVIVVRGGMTKWNSDGLPVERGR